MRHVRSLLLVCIATAVPNLASAADMPWGRAPTVISERGAPEEEIGSGWYLRGDIGYARAAAPSLDLGTTHFSNVGRDGAVIYGGGFGYKFSEWFRADLTVDQISSYGLRSRIGSVPCFWGGTCSVDRKFDGAAMPILANAYVDFGNWGGFSPYVGGGVGVARMRASGTFTYTEPTLGVGVRTMADSGVRWSPAFAAMAGLAIDLGSGVQIDAGYRYLWLSEGSTGAMTQSGAAGVVPGTAELKNTGFHQARVGLRYFVN